MTGDPIGKRLAAALEDVAGERRRQGETWGDQSHCSDFELLAILTEEVGEAAQAALHDKHGGRAAGTLRAELVQVAAVAVQWIEAIDKRAAT